MQVDGAGFGRVTSPKLFSRRLRSPARLVRFWRQVVAHSVPGATSPQPLRSMRSGGGARPAAAAAAGIAAVTRREGIVGLRGGFAAGARSIGVVRSPAIAGVFGGGGVGVRSATLAHRLASLSVAIAAILVECVCVCVCVVGLGFVGRGAGKLRCASRHLICERYPPRKRALSSR